MTFFNAYLLLLTNHGLLVKGGTHSFLVHKMRTSFYEQNLFSDNHLHYNNVIAFGFYRMHREMRTSKCEDDAKIGKDLGCYTDVL